MASSVIGFPRFGMDRQLKKATEQYFSGKIGREALRLVADDLKRSQWTMLQNAGVSFIPSNDFSLYDGMLDTMWMLNAIPKRYLELGLDDFDTYFAMARGYQSKAGDVGSLGMRKWFNTNYHYRVPELDAETTLSLRSTDFLPDYRLAKDMGVETKPVVIGPFTFLKLARHADGLDSSHFVEQMIDAYRAVIAACDEDHVRWLQIDEPYLVMDLSDDDIALFFAIYGAILELPRTVDVLLQTYFGDICDCYRAVCDLPFDGIGLDFVEGRETAALIEREGFPGGALLFTGVVNGKNVWRCNYDEALRTLASLPIPSERIVVGTSCSLLHVPYTVARETRLSVEIRSRLAFALEKLEELAELSSLLGKPSFRDDVAFIHNRELFQHPLSGCDGALRHRIEALRPEDFSRKDRRAVRRESQKQRLGLPVLPTTTIGSFAQTAEVRQNRARLKRGMISSQQYEKIVRMFIKDCVRQQERLDLDVLVHGEYERNDMVEYFAQQLDGFVTTDDGWVQSYGTRGVKPAIIVSDVRRPRPMTVPYISYAQSLTDRPVKGMLTGPATILNWSFPREDIPLKESMFQIALAIQDEVLDLERAGIGIIQIDEAALREKLPLRKADWKPQYLDFAIDAFRLCHETGRGLPENHCSSLR
ncbi:MAG: 5-methyltetrahydropteroyltriglutamate--homocysteine S-methyltransferase [Sphaerochaetaceae bacterium]|jgi:5-methyltetrahydropteroyltriglutamate--homocysteine methyltransferase